MHSAGLNRQNKTTLPDSPYAVFAIDEANRNCQTNPMEICFTPEQEARLDRIALLQGVAPAQLVRDATLSLLEEDQAFRAAVKKGAEEADQELFVGEAEMETRVSHLMTL